MTNNKIGVSKAAALLGLSLIALMTSGCVSKTLVAGMYNSSMEYQNLAPNLAEIGAYPTNDPELKDFLTIIGSLDRDLQGVRGKEETPTERKTRLKETEANMRKAFAEMESPLSARARMEMVEKILKDQRERPPISHLAIVPKGADPKSAMAMTFKLDGMNERLENQVTSVSFTYSFSSAEKMTEKAYELIEKLRPVFAARPGWKFMDPAWHIKSTKDGRAIQAEVSAQNKKYNIKEDQEANRKLYDLEEKSMQQARAGLLIIGYEWENKFRINISDLNNLKSSDSISITLAPVPKALYSKDVNAKDTLTIMFSRTIAQERKK